MSDNSLTHIEGYAALNRLDAIFSPQSVAVIGATEKDGSVGRTILANLMANNGGLTIYPVNPQRETVLGLKSYPSIKAVPGPLDLAVVVTPAKTVPAIIGDCADCGVRGAIVISAGFKECGAGGVELERELLCAARRGNMRIIGPNCLGVMAPTNGLNATFAKAMALPGNVAFISQSGALCTAILDWSFRENVGFSLFASIGSMLDVGWSDLIDYAGDDPDTKSIVLYMESIGDARSFLSAAREVARRKPIIVIKAGRTDAAAKAAASHTGALTGSYDVLNAAFRRSGVLPVNTIAELFYMAEALSMQPCPQGPNLTIITNAGGPGVLATDALIATGGTLAELAPSTISALNEHLPVHWSHGNPIDVLGDAGADRFAKAVEIAEKDPGSDGLLVVLSPQAMTDATKTAEVLRPYAKSSKPIIASWMGGDSIAEGKKILNDAGIPAYPYPDTAARMFNHMYKYAYNLRGLYETPRAAEETNAILARESAAKFIDGILDSGRTLLTELESKQLLGIYGIPVVPTILAKSADDAVVLAEKVGYPVVLKLNSLTITHKTEVGGVQLDLRDAHAVRAAYQKVETSVCEKYSAEHFAGVTIQPMISNNGYEVILGSSPDPQFGPVLLFGMGGQLVEVLKDRALGLPPLNTTLALRMMEQTHIYEALKGVRGRKAVDLAGLEKLMVRFSELVVEHPRIKEIDINPLIVTPDKILAVDGRVLLYPKEIKQDQLPRPAIRSYPIQYVHPFHIAGVGAAEIRPIRPDDEALLVKFHESLSEHTVMMRFFNPMEFKKRVTHERLSTVCSIDYDREMALVADGKDPKSGAHRLLGVIRMIKLKRTDKASFTLVVSDECQHHGLGTELLTSLIKIAREEKITELLAAVHPENIPMLKLVESLDFEIQKNPAEPFVKVARKIYS